MVLRVCLSKHPFHALCNKLCIFFVHYASFYAFEDIFTVHGT